MASRTKLSFKKKSGNFAHSEMPAEGPSAPNTSQNGDDEVFAMTLGKFVSAIRKRGAADKSPRKGTNGKFRVFPKKPIDQKQGTQGSSVLIPPRQSCDDAYILNDSHVRDDENSIGGGATEGSGEIVTQMQEVLVEHCNSGFGKNARSPGTSTHYDQDELQIGDSLLSPQEVTRTQCQSQEDVHHNIADATATLVKGAQTVATLHTDANATLMKGAHMDATLVEGQTEKYLHHKKRRTSLSARCTTSSKRRSKKLPLSFSRSGKSNSCLGSMKELENQREESIGTMLSEAQQQAKSFCSLSRLNAAKSRWKNLAQRILRTKICPKTLAFANEGLVKDQVVSHTSIDVPGVEEQIRSIANSKRIQTHSRPKKQRKSSTAANSLTGRLQQKERNQQRSLQKRMKTWLAEAKFSQGLKEKSSNDTGEEFIMTEDERRAFARSVVQSCQKNPNMQIAFLESVRMLASSGLMQAAASNLLLQGPCKEAQVVMDAWAEFKEQNAITKTLPVNLFSAVNQLHEKRGDLSSKLGMPNNLGICAMSRIDEKTWKFQLPGSHLEDSLLPRNMEQDITVRKSFC